MRIILLICTLLLTSCGTYVTQRQKEVAGQSLADLNAAAGYVSNVYRDTPAALAADAMTMHAQNMAKAMEIDLADLPRARVTDRDWQQDPNRSHQESRNNANTDSKNILDYGLYALSGVTIAILMGKVATTVLANHPVGQLLGGLGHIFGGESPKQRKVLRKLISILEEYKAVDPKWRENPLYLMLSDKLTTAEKEYIKSERENV